MTMGNALPKMSLQDFLAWEDAQPERHEFVRGEVYAMVGARRVHNKVSGSVYSSLLQQLKGTRCEAFIETAKLQTPSGSVLYPDVFVTCDAADLRTEQLFTAPTLIVEVLSSSTQAYDRALKFTLYRQIESLREYVLIDPDTREVQCFRRNPEGLFVLHDLTGAAVVEFPAIGCRITAEDLFYGVEPRADEGTAT
jgi:Uma2 family endonuclease